MADSKPIPDDEFRCRNCAGPLSKNMITRNNWLDHCSFSKRQFLSDWISCWWYRKYIRWFQPCDADCSKAHKGPMWLHFFVGAPPVIVFSSACAGWLVGGAVPGLAQLASSSDNAAMSSSSLPPSSQKG